MSSIPSGNTFYVGEGAKFSIGPKTRSEYTTSGGGGYQVGGFNWLSYTSEVPLTLTSARMYTGNPGKVTIMVVDTVKVGSDIEFYIPPLSSTTIDVYSTSSTQDTSARNYDPNDNGAVFYINLSLPAGKHVIMDTTVDAKVDRSAISNATIFRNNNGNYPYPFKEPDVISITGNSATTTQKNYWYYSYDMKMQTADCVSDRTAVSVSVPTNVNFNAWPNPNQGVFTVLLNAGTASTEVQIELYDLLGRRCYSQTYSASGISSKQINAGNLITGMYILHVKAGSNNYKKMILISR